MNEHVILGLELLRGDEFKKPHAEGALARHGHALRKHGAERTFDVETELRDRALDRMGQTLDQFERLAGERGLIGFRPALAEPGPRACRRECQIRLKVQMSRDRDAPARIIGRLGHGQVIFVMVPVEAPEGLVGNRELTHQRRLFETNKPTPLCFDQLYKTLDGQAHPGNIVSFARKQHGLFWRRYKTVTRLLSHDLPPGIDGVSCVDASQDR